MVVPKNQSPFEAPRRLYIAGMWRKRTAYWTAWPNTKVRQPFWRCSLRVGMGGRFVRSLMPSA